MPRGAREREVRHPARIMPTVPNEPPMEGLASSFLRVAVEADRAERAQHVPGERRQYPAGAMPDKSPIKRRKRVRF